MKLIQLEVKGFKSLKEATWRPGDLNVVIGPNGSGKSNLLRLLEMISASARGRLAEWVQKAGGFDTLVWDGQADAISFIATATSEPYDKGLFQYALACENDSFNKYTITHEMLKEKIEYSSDKNIDNINKPENIFLSRTPKDNFINYDGNRRNIDSQKINDEESLLSSVLNPFLDLPLLGIHQVFLCSWCIFYVIRMDQKAAIRQNPFIRHTSMVDPESLNLINVLHTQYTGDPNYKNEIDNAMSAAFGDDFDQLDFAPVPETEKRIRMITHWKSRKRGDSVFDLSDGTLRYLFLLAVLGNPTPPPLIAIDEPENDLHPSMLPIIAEYAVEASKKTQVIFTTHSAAFLDAFRDVQPTTTVASWEDGATLLRTIDGDELSYWLKNYTLGDLYASGHLEAME